VFLGNDQFRSFRLNTKTVLRNDIHILWPMSRAEYGAGN
jgi:hypothetical protein